MSAAYAQSYSIVFSALVSLTGGTVPQGAAVTKSSDGTSYVVASTANLATSSSGTIDGVALETGAAGSQIHIQRDAKVPASILGFTGAGSIENAVVDSNGLVRRASQASGIVIGIVDKEGGVQINLSGAVSSISFSLSGDANGPIGATTVSGLQGRPVLSTAPAAGNALGWNGSAWTPGLVDLVFSVQNTLAASHGGTGLTSPGTSGNVLTSNGSAWVSQAPTGGTPGSPSTSLQYDNGGVFGGASEFTYGSSKLNVSASGAITLGTNGGSVASGYIRAPGGATTILNTRNNANGADMPVIATDTSDGMSFASGAVNAYFGSVSGGAGATGSVYLGVTSGGLDTYVQATTGHHVYGTVAGSVVTDVTAAGLAVTGVITTTGNIQVGASSVFVWQTSGVQISTGTGVPATSPANGSIFLRQDGTSTTAIYSRQSGSWIAIAGGSTSPGGSNTQMQYNNSGAFGGTAEFTYASSKLNCSSSGAITFGATPAAAACLRHTNNTTFSAFRHSNGLQDCIIAIGDGSNNLYMGGNSSGTSAAVNTYMVANTACWWIVNTTTVAGLTTSCFGLGSGYNMSVGGGASPTMNSATNTIFFINGTAATTNPANGMYLSCSPDKAVGTGQFPTFIGQASTCGIQFETVTSGSSGKADNAKIKICVPVDGTWTQKYINITDV